MTNRCILKGLFGALLLCLLFSANPLIAQSDISVELKRARGLEMLEWIKKDLKERYYDPTFHGIDIERSYAQSREYIKKSNGGGNISAVIAQFLLDLDDSHTFFLPDEKSGFVELGFTVQMYDKGCYVTAVKKGSNAETSGLKAGDMVYSFENFEPTRESLWKLEYLYRTLNPQEIIHLVIQDPNGTLRNVDVKARFVKWEDYQKELDDRKKRPKNSPFDCKQFSAETSVCRLKTFGASEEQIDKLMKSVGTSQNLILDLRQNSGGYVETMKHFIGYFFDREVKVGTEKMRKSEVVEIAKPHKDKVFTGKLIVLVDSRSASAAEVFPRVIQLEKRGMLIGERTAGAVMTANRAIRLLMPRAQSAFVSAIPYGASITIADLLMSDGKSLEKTGVMPEIFMVPTGDDLLKKRDPVLAKAISEFGGTITPAEAGKFFLDAAKNDPDDADNFE